MRSPLRDTLAELMMEAVESPAAAAPLCWLSAYCALLSHGEPSFAAWAVAVKARTDGTPWCDWSGEDVGRHLIEEVGLLVEEEGHVLPRPEYRGEWGEVAGVADRYWKCLQNMHERSYPPGLAGTLLRGAVLWQYHCFFEFHELVEPVWMAWRGAGKDFLRGLIQLAVAFYHIQQGNRSGALAKFGKGLAKVAPHRPCYLGVELEGFLQAIDRCWEIVKTRHPEDLAEFDWSLVPPMIVREATQTG
ncbi:MAG: DUF309 domain-containing protein [Candidatus Methylomirabilales bacterium]